MTRQKNREINLRVFMHCHPRNEDYNFDEGVRGWIIKVSLKNYWRVHRHMDLDDLIMEGFLKFALVKSKYGDKKFTKAHFMALYKTSFLREIHDFASKSLKAKYGIGKEFCVTDVLPPEATPVHHTQLLETLGGSYIPDFFDLNQYYTIDVYKLFSKFDVGTFGKGYRRKVTKSGKQPINEWLNCVMETCGINYEDQLRGLLS